MCPWGFDGPGFSITWASEGIEAVVMNLMDRSIVSVVALDYDATNPVIQFDDGSVFSVFADTDLDPWWLRLEGITIVGQLPR